MQKAKSNKSEKPNEVVKLYSVKEVAELWGCSERLIARLISERKIQFVRIGRLKRISASEISRYVEDHTTETFDAKEFAYKFLENR